MGERRREGRSGREIKPSQAANPQQNPHQEKFVALKPQKRRRTTCEKRGAEDRRRAGAGGREHTDEATTTKDAGNE